MWMIKQLSCSFLRRIKDHVCCLGDHNCFSVYPADLNGDLLLELLTSFGTICDYQIGCGRSIRIPTFAARFKRIHMLNIVLFGPPGSGKGTQSENLIKRYDLVHLSTGDIFRANIGGGTALGKLAKSYMDAGNLVPDEVTIQMLASEVEKNPEAKGFIFDGFPRTSPQAQALDDLLTEMNTSITSMLSLEVPEDELKTRLIKRAETSGRSDDANPEIIQNRIDVYNKETAPVADFYRAQQKFQGIHGVGSKEEIAERLCAAID